MRKVVIVFATVVFLFLSSVGKAESTDFFFSLVQSGRLNDVRSYISQGKNINVKDNNGITALMFAAFQGNKDMTQLLLNKGAR